ncbi:MAG: TraB/GumN family protein [Gammaproteobacteria bacterium]
MRVLAVLLALACPSIAAADGFPLWTVEGDAGTVYILGSVHVLKAGDYPLPAPVSEAYAAADELLMELDLDDLDVAAVTTRMLELGASGDDATAREVFGDDAWETVVSRGRSLGLDLGAMAAVEPWLAALMAYNLALAQAGYDPDLGVDQHLAGRAMADGKPIAGLETLAEQLDFFDSLAPEAQRQLLEQTLDSLDELATEADALVAAWRSGDLAALGARLEEDFEDYPELEQRLVTDRNQAWLPAIEARLARPGETLVVVGALHVVGPEGLPALLKSRGYAVQSDPSRPGRETP